MALSSYWVSQNRKDLAEKAIVSKRERDASRVQKCLEVDSYHRDLARTSSKYRSLEEGQALKTPRANEESSVREELIAIQKEKLESRRQKLAHLLAVENEQYMKELQKIKDHDKRDDVWNIRKLKKQIEDLQAKRKEAEQSMQKRYSNHIFNPSFTSLKKSDDELLQKEISEAWQQRKQELEKLSLEKQQMEKEKLKSLDLAKSKALLEADEVRKLQLDEEEQCSSVIEEKINELNKAERETKRLKNEKELLVNHLETLRTLQKRRDTVRDMQKETFKKMQSMWQPKEKLRRMLIEVMHALDLDIKLITSVLGFNNTFEEPNILDLSFVEDVKNKLDMQVALEREREVEILHMYNEEAIKVVGKKMEQWSLESIARDEVMKDMFESLAKEINGKFESNVERHNKLIEVKKELLKEVDETNTRVKETIKSLEEKRQFHLYEAGKLDEELELFQANLISRPSSVREKKPY